MAVALGGMIGAAVVKNLVDIVFSYLKDQSEWGANIKSALSKLKTALLQIQVALERAEKVELNLHQNPRLGEWIWDLRDTVEEAEDVLDEMEYNRLEHQILERDAKEKLLIPGSATSSGFKFKLVKFFKVHGCCSASLFKHNCVKIGKRALKMDDTLKKLNAVVEQLELVNKGINDLNNIINVSPLLLGGNNSNTKNSRETGHINTDEVVGQAEDKEEVLKWLTKSGGDYQDSQNISALTIWGVGGLGKTTLAQSVYNDDSLNFEVKMWVCVSNNNIDMVELMKKAIETKTGSLPTATSLSSLQEELKNIVKSKKCLLVLDDVWDGQENQNQQQWENFVGILSQYAERGSKILVTSRMKYQGLPKKIRNDFLPLGCLNKDESLSLFYKHAFDGVNPNKHTNLKSVGGKIAEKCGGLPLALKIIGGLLNSNLDIIYWLSVLEKNILNLEENINYMKEVLKLSYKCLPSNLQACFRICSLFPQDYEFKEDELVEVWIGLGCINQCSDENIPPEDIGRNYLNLLVMRSFFIHNHAEKTFVVHDLLHDLARDVSTGECLRVEGYKSVTLPKTLRHLFIDQLNSDLIFEISSLKRLRTLAVNYKYGKHISKENVPYCGELNDNLKQLRSLHALFISIRTMPDLTFIEQLKHLRLFQMNVGISNKPLKPLYKLYQLQNLKCKEPEISDAHDLVECDGIGNLVKLRHLVLPPRIFDKITQLRHLIALQEVQLHIKKDNASSLRDLKDLNKLRCLSITNECETTNIEEAKEANIEKKEHLETLSLSLKGPNHDFQLQEQLCNCLKPRTQSKITDLKVVNYSGVKAPSWMTTHYLPYMTHLKLSEWENLEHLPPLGQLPSLKVLSLEKISGVKRSGIEFFGNDDIGGFPSLEELRIEEMENWEEWTRVDDANWFPCLKEIYIINCQQLKELPALPVCLKKLCLESVGLQALPTWHDIDEHEVSTSQSNTRVDLQALKSNCLDYLSITKCHNLITSSPAESLDQTHSPISFHVKRLNIDNILLLQIEPLRSIKSVKKLTVKDDVHASCLPHQWLLQNHISLEYLRIWNCPVLESLPDELPSSLTELQIINCLQLKSLPESMPSSLNILQIRNCPLVKELLPDNIPSSLVELRIWNCALLKSLPERTTYSLKIFQIFRCPLVELLPNSILSSLEHLLIFECPLLEERYKRDGGFDWHKIAHIPTIMGGIS